MKKHDEKKQGTVGSVSNRNHVKERKAKPKDIDKTQQETCEEIRQNTQQTKTKLICYGRNSVGDKHRRQWSKHRRAGAPLTCTQPI